MHQDPNDNQGDICNFCQRSRPIFCVDTDDMILRLPEKFLPPFLKQMKSDYLSKSAYLKFLRINSKMIEVCPSPCSNSMAHAYCATAFVLQKQQIYCGNCFDYFHLYVKSERVFSSEYMGGMV